MLGEKRQEGGGSPIGRKQRYRSDVGIKGTVKEAYVMTKGEDWILKCGTVQGSKKWFLKWLINWGMKLLDVLR